MRLQWVSYDLVIMVVNLVVLFSLLSRKWLRTRWWHPIGPPPLLGSPRCAFTSSCSMLISPRRPPSPRGSTHALRHSATRWMMAWSTTWNSMFRRITSSPVQEDCFVNEIKHCNSYLSQQTFRTFSICPAVLMSFGRVWSQAWKLSSRVTKYKWAKGLVSSFLKMGVCWTELCIVLFDRNGTGTQMQPSIA